MKTLTHFTKYPKLYRKFTWGSLMIDKSSPQDEIIANRNKFAEEYELIKYINFEHPGIDSHLFDHCELYKTNFGVVFVTSPYEDASKEAEKFDFSPYSKLYHQDASTYLKEFDSKADYLAFVEKWKELQGEP